MSGLPLVTVMVPIVEAEAHLAQCLASILAQEHAALDILCVNQATMDNSVDLVKSAMRRDARIRLLTLEPGDGPATLLPRVLAAAQGEAILIVNGQDWITGDAVARLLAAQAEQDADFAFSDYSQIDAGGRLQRVAPFHSPAAQHAAETGALRFRRGRAVLADLHAGPTLGLMRRDVLAAVLDAGPVTLGTLVLAYGARSCAMAYLDDALSGCRASTGLRGEPQPTDAAASAAIEQMFALVDRAFEPGDAIPIAIATATRILAQRFKAVEAEPDGRAALLARAAVHLARFEWPDLLLYRDRSIPAGLLARLVGRPADTGADEAVAALAARAAARQEAVIADALAQSRSLSLDVRDGWSDLVITYDREVDIADGLVICQVDSDAAKPFPLRLALAAAGRDDESADPYGHVLTAWRTYKPGRNLFVFGADDFDQPATRPDLGRVHGLLFGGDKSAMTAMVSIALLKDGAHSDLLASGDAPSANDEAPP